MSLLNVVPFANGSEYVTEDWIRQLFTELNRIFGEDIKDYNGTVSFYLGEKSQTLSVPSGFSFIWLRAARGLSICFFGNVWHEIRK